MNAHQRHKFGRPSRGMSSNPPPKSTGESWFRLISFLIIGIPGGSRGTAFSDTPAWAMRDSNPQEVTCSFSPRPKKKVIKSSTKTILSNTFPAVFQAQYIKYPSKLLVCIVYNYIMLYIYIHYIYHQYIVIIMNRSKPRLPLSPLALFTALRQLHVWIAYRYVMYVMWGIAV